jgi:putative phage-type endonuclease
MITKVKTNNRKEWLAERKKSLGGSDMGAVLGMNSYTSPVAVWMDKTGRLPEKEQTEWMRLGTDLEDYVAQRFCEASGLKVVKDNYTWRNSKYPHLHMNPDRRIVGQKAGFEAKIVSQLNEKKYRGGDFPDSYYAQVVTYLCVSEYDRWYLGALILGEGLRIYQMTRIPDDTKPDWCIASVYVDDEELKAVGDTAENFWGYVERDTPPPADGHPKTGEALAALYPNSNFDAIGIGAFERELDRYFALKAQAKELEEQINGIENRIKAHLGEYERGEGEKYRISWKTQQRTTFDYRRLITDNPGLDVSGYFKTSTSRPFKVTITKGVK